MGWIIRWKNWLRNIRHKKARNSFERYRHYTEEKIGDYETINEMGERT